MRKEAIFIPAMIILLAGLVMMNPACMRVPASMQEIRIGVIQSLTGEYAHYGEGAVFGIKAAVEDINSLGGVGVDNRRIPIKLIVYDSLSDPEKTDSLADTLIKQEKVHFMAAGNEPYRMHSGVSTVCDQYEIPFVTSVSLYEPWQAEKQQSETGWQYTWAAGMFALATPAQALDFRAAKPGYTVLDTWMDLLKYYSPDINKNVAMFATDDPEGRSWYNTFGPPLRELGYMPQGWDIKMGIMPSGITDFSSAINFWKTGKCEILWGNAQPEQFKALWEQCRELGYRPKVVCAARAALFYEDTAAWGTDLSPGIHIEAGWDPSFQNCQGAGSTTPASLAERWVQETGKPLNRNIASGYSTIQVLTDAIQRAGTLKPGKINQALAETDLITIGHRVKFDEDHFSRCPVVITQWVKTSGNSGWEQKMVFSRHQFAPASTQPVSPVNSPDYLLFCIVF